MKLLYLGTLSAIATAAVFAIDPERVSIFPPCPLHRYTGLWCPGCGTTRALHQLLHGNVAAAFWFNPLAISLLPVIGYLSLRWPPDANAELAAAFHRGLLLLGCGSLLLRRPVYRTPTHIPQFNTRIG